MAIKKSSSSGIPFGNTAGRPASEIGRLYSNGETARLELFTQASGLATAAKNLVFKSGNETAQLIFTDFTISTGANIVTNNSGGTLFAF